MQDYITKVRINKRQDKQICHYFINSKIDDFDFGKERIIDLHPKLGPIRKKDKSEINKKIDEYIDSYYAKNREKILESKLYISETWKEIEGEYFRKIQELFNREIKLKNNIFTCYISIFICSPLIEPQGWQIYYKIKEKAEIKRLFAHEIMHFFYYDYIEKNKEVKSFYKNMEDNEYWTKAEVFNVMTLNETNFKNLTEKREEGYDIHKKYFKDFQKIWDKSNDLNEYLIEVSKLKI